MWCLEDFIINRIYFSSNLTNDIIHAQV